MFKLKKETAVGLFVLVGLIAVGYMSVKLGKVQLFTDKYYSLHANFSDVSGLKANAPVQMFGVDIGFVKTITLDQDKGVARVSMMIEKQVALTDDAIVSVKTNGLIGDKYIKIAPGGVGDPVKPDDTLFDTNPAIDLEDLISKFAFGKV
ncbi:MAG: outer membrane lipid asymmetry maintenance protein MlaD [Pseudodesulfovibrio sp.]|uniref:Mammalian cell entry related domain protein n=1 Tax=Pseudodesulfovibrio aespoeensis (strain ATCC 700646 / DSM 10631 / Aspo-2) TaxID=643562 RepID=E6VZN0_PSEA9|nr:MULTISPECIES: outer membrane lipid asymmetry maintenance protein MlaD [Pseudodesulfovibrio]MBU4192204.1 outer membrane lipid asymmetry maintenance protein MlaD [Pseudomonadota bacterium]ADU61744.1 Mammalian cell entry related domain protein [Pseudodesulfovibrio aespoeensis Aspo-2]MBU4378605.1 outer membrane lipid asymmetry maintenance protein MlaD [Pseudomonadota bacterium]MBU4475804.1 outer membrane lipid asymmetry maintenance protein MlaD [Pseudomonadota bacterium]MBU4515787.1 outer membr